MTSAIIGKGIVDWVRVLPTARKASVSSAYLEIEEPYEPSAMAMVRASYAYLKGQI